MAVGEGVTGAVVRALAEGVTPPRPFSVRAFRPLPPPPPGERAITVDQTNHSVIAGESVVVKWFPRPSRAPHPAPDLLAHLSGFSRTATPYAAVYWEDALVALITAYLPEARDGWEWCVDEAEAGRTAFAAELGGLAAELHLAMATPSPVFPDPVRLAHAVPEQDPEQDPTGGSTGGAASGAGAWAARAEEALRDALALTDGEDGAWLASRAEALRHELAPLATAGATPLIRIHGDLHVGQILRWRDGYAVVDFDGNPTVSGSAPGGGAFQPAARDLAQLTTSVDHVGQVAILRRNADPDRIAEWVAASRAAIEGAYAAGLADAGRADLLDRSLIRPFEIEQECRELIYAARHLPRWRYAPMGVLRTWFGAGPAFTK
ncbi:hypothetical protein IMZ11_23860 [Microtetraspora sp. AC03309]|uniref:hypothetical protein n=1 Tax=Microtetraspora sp. AC03309 TaxID=2779376 RepID=UPI001E54AFD4|nr:hypothetical protein [Microtetraspora sp. AC03309]MCC5578667.1 hypothetical protein [Microtetraspora sp. AC03309]